MNTKPGTIYRDEDGQLWRIYQSGDAVYVMEVSTPPRYRIIASSVLATWQ